MPLLHDLCSSDEVLALLRPPAGGPPRSWAILGEDRRVALRAFETLLLLLSERGIHTLACLEAADLPGLEERLPSVGVVRPDGVEVERRQSVLRSFLRQDPDLILCSQATGCSELLLNAVLTGHQVVGVFDQATPDALLASVGSVDPMLVRHGLGALDFLQLDARHSGDHIVRICRFDPTLPEPTFVDRARRRTPPFELGRDEGRDAAFFRNLYEVLASAPPESAPRSTPAPATAIPAPTPALGPVVDPVECLPLPAELHRSLRPLRRVAFVPVVAELGPEVDAELSTLQADTTLWPRDAATGKPCLLALQLDTDALPPELAFLPPGQWLQLFTDGADTLP